MPHLVLEYSANVVDPPPCLALFEALRAVLVESQAFAPEDIKSRAVCLSDYLIGDGAPERAMVHLEVRVLGGRDISVRQHLTQACLRLLAQHFERTLEARDCALSVELREMERSTYGKQRGPLPAG